jgi:hypothetical protein
MSGMTHDERWYNFRYQFIETGWFDYDRDKTIEAMRKLAERIPEDVVDNLPPLTVFAPSTVLLGRVFPMLASVTPGSVFLYLGPRLETLSQKEVDFTVAHEFAHVALRHYKPGAGTHPPVVLIKRHQDVPTERDP